MLDTLDKNEVAPNTPTGAPTAMTIGAELRRLVEADPASHSSTTIRRIGQLDVQLVRWENKWTLYLADLTPIPHGTRDLWATAVSAPSVEWSQTPDGCSAWCEWTVSGPVRG